jgi:hypothetical protein
MHQEGWNRLSRRRFLVVMLAAAGAGLAACAPADSSTSAEPPSGSVLTPAVVDEGRPAPELTSNFERGAPGSQFVLRGHNFPADATANITANDKPIGTIPTDAEGSFTFALDTTDAPSGSFLIIAEASTEKRALQATGEPSVQAMTLNPFGRVLLTLDHNEPRHIAEMAGLPTLQLH